MEEEFEDSSIIEITPNISWIRKHDEGVKKDVKESWILALATLVCILLAIPAFRFSMALTVILGILAAGGLVMLLLWRRSLSKSALNTAYADGMMTEGMVVKTQPLTIAAIADIRTTSRVKKCYGCYFLEVKQLPGMKGELYEKVPCACRFYEDEGNYWSYFQPRPLCWGTPDRQEIEEVCRLLEREQQQAGNNLWEVIQRIAEQFPDMENESMVKLDENFCPVGYKPYYKKNYTLFQNGAVQKNYRKQQQQAEPLTGDIPSIAEFNRLLDLSLKHGTYDYLNLPCNCGDYGVYSKTGFFTYFGDGVEFLEAEQRRNIPFVQGEVPLIGGEVLLTTRGAWRKKEFFPWDAVSFSTKVNADDKIEVRVNGKLSVAVPCHVKEYEGHEQFGKSDIPVVQELERKRVQDFLDDVKQEFMKY